MNPPNPNLGRPPSYPYTPPNASNLGVVPPQHTRPASPLPAPIQTGPQGHAYSPSAVYGQPPPPGPPGYTPAEHRGYAQGYGVPMQYRNEAVEVEGAGRSKAQLIVGIDFVGQPSDSSISAHLVLTEALGDDILRGSFCVCYKYGSEGGHYYGVARRWQSDQAEGQE